MRVRKNATAWLTFVGCCLATPVIVADNETTMTVSNTTDAMNTQTIHTRIGLGDNLIGDGSFESNDGSWVITGTAFNPRCSVFNCGPDLATDGFVYLWLGGGEFDNGNGGSATQTLTIPTNASELSFDWIMDSNDEENTCESPADDRLEVLIDGTLIWRSPDPCIRQNPAATEVIDIAALGYADGGVHTLVFQAFNVDATVGSEILTNVFLDNVILNTIADIDTDADGVFDSIDNCTLVQNAGQEDTNGDGIGNACDADVTNNCLVNFQDIALFPPKFNSADGDANYDEDFDLNSSGNINFLDYIIFTNSFNQAPGPSANECVPGLGT